MDLKLLSDWERQKLFYEREADNFQVVRKRGPREQLNPVQYAKEQPAKNPGEFETIEKHQKEKLERMVQEVERKLNITILDKTGPRRSDPATSDSPSRSQTRPSPNKSEYTLTNKGIDEQDNVVIMQNVPEERSGQQMVDYFMDIVMKDRNATNEDDGVRLTDEKDGAPDLDSMEPKKEGLSGTAVSLSPSDHAAYLHDEAIKEAAILSAADVQKP